MVKKHSILGLPAVERNGVLKWYVDGMKHRDILPAYIGKGVLKWYQNRLLHRCGDLPAFINRPHGDLWEWRDSYYINGVLHRYGDLPAVVDARLNRLCWYVDGKLHRENGPAKTSPGILECYYIDGEMHRDILPAYIYECDAYKESRWYQRGKLGRPDAPDKPIALS